MKNSKEKANRQANKTRTIQIGKWKVAWEGKYDRYLEGLSKDHLNCNFDKVFLPPLPKHLIKIIKKHKKVHGARYYLISKNAKETINQFKIRWKKNQLSTRELGLFYDAVNDLVICARTREDFLIKERKEYNQSCLAFLMIVLEPLIKAEVAEFIKNHSDIKWTAKNA